MTSNSKYGFIRVAAAVPKMKVGDIKYNTEQIIDFAQKASAQGALFTVFPELCITGYTLGDLFHQKLVTESTIEALGKIAKASKTIESILAVGLPIICENKLFNAAAIISEGKILGIVPKTYIPNYKEFYEERWFASANDLKNSEIELFGQNIPVGTDILFKLKNKPEVVLGVEICEDLWVPIPPSSHQAINGATIIANLSASNDLIGKADYRKNLVSQQSARGICGYIYTSCGVHESTTDVVFGGHAIIAENGAILKESKRFEPEGELILSDIDIEHIVNDREKTTSFGESADKIKNFRFINIKASPTETGSLNRYIDPSPFVPSNASERDKRAEEIFSIQSTGLAKRLRQTKIKKITLGLSGGLDSTLALLVAVKTFKILGLPLKDIHCYTMPGFGTTKRTKSNAIKLAEAIGTSIETIDITKGSKQNLEDVGHDTKTQDLTFENVQARYRTMTLMNKANLIKGFVLGTGDLSEIALGWNTFSGDQISHYNVNASIPKTLVKYLVKWISEQDDFKSSKKILADILDTPISPELIKTKGDNITQKTEDLVGPYELHDFFLYHFLRWNSSPSKILFLAVKTFDKKYKPEIIKKWLTIFITRFFHNQWKRSVMPDGPKVGSVALSPRGDWRMPSDAEVDLWLKDLNA